MPFQGAFQTTFVGSTIRLISGNRLLRHHDEIDVPERYTKEGVERRRTEMKGRRFSAIEMASGPDYNGNEKQDQQPRRQGRSEDARRESKWDYQTDPLGENTNGVQLSQPIDRTLAENNNDGGIRRSTSDETIVEPSTPTDTSQEKRVESEGKEGKKAGNAQEAEEGRKADEDDPNLVHWYGDDDPENPYNWSTSYKAFVACQMSFLTFAVYVGSSIYTAGLEGVMEQFTVSQTTALVGLTVFVLGYGVGPMLWSPISELSNVGRMPVYISTLFIFVALQFPTIYANNIHTLLAMRFLAGFFGSPALAIGGATMGDMFVPKYLAYAIGVWGCGAVCGPVLGPLLGGFTYQAKGWTWPLWVLTWLAGLCLLTSAIFLPETSGKNILHRRMLRLRKVTGNKDLKTQAMIDTAHITPGQVIKDTLLRPFVLLFDPILLVLNLYISLIYGLLYVWFESFPLVFVQNHGFNPGESGLAFLGIFVGSWLACAVFCWYIHVYLEPIFDKNDGVIPCPEIRLYPAPIAAVCIPIAMFGFGWSGMYPSVHWIVPVIMTSFFGIGAFILFQTIFAYFGDVFYDEVASVYTLNDLFRATFGAAFPLFANAIFKHLGIGGGCSLLGGIACLFIPAPFLFIKYGHKIRAKSKFASNKS
ncbi:hypothetical protein CI109_102055 [Kwoniella shandongensis]|uniref:Uncharacterized protein n=1 Tax=Kwoniella shandongensis TaxID=1734106 RepID=A0A5M6BQK0_9TREE|nr:uncharacterized protein CI109_006536 [Kwoniella shandongensis]KAA5525166.1 hypothetical protein CI109_006536 [Kwoniella shandongensis]